MGTSQSTRKVSSQDKAILDLKLQRDKIKQYQRKIEGILQRERQIAADALKQGNKQRALLALRRRKFQESLLTKTDSQLATLQGLVSSIEFSLVEKDVLFGLQQGTAVLKELNQQTSVESVEKLMGETADAIAYQNEIDEMLSSRLTAEDEEDVEKELERLQAEQIGAKLPDLPADKVPEPLPLENMSEDERTEPIKERSRQPVLA